MTAIPPAYGLHAAVALCAVGVTAVLFGIATTIDTGRGRASCGDACTAFGLMCCAMALDLVGWSAVGLPALAGVALVRMVIAVAAAIGRRRDTGDDAQGDAEAGPAVRQRRVVGGQRAADAGDVVVRLETPIDEADLFARPDRPRAAMDAIVRQLGEGSSIVAIQARRG